MEKNRTFRREVLRRLEHLLTGSGAMDKAAFLIGAAVEHGFEEKVLAYLDRNPGAALDDILQRARDGWIPAGPVWEADGASLEGFENRMMEKLSRFVTDEGSRYRIWDEIIFVSMDRQIMESMERYVDSHPQASYEELRDCCRRLSGGRR